MSEASMDAMQDMAAPGPEHDRLKPFLGTFKAEVRIWMGSGDPMVSTGVMTNILDLGGKFVKQDYKGDPSPEPTPFPRFEGRGFWGYNKNTRQYEGFWIDTASTIMQTEFGEVDESGKVWTMIGEMAGPDGNTFSKRSVITLVDDDHHHMEMYFTQGDQEHKGMEIRYVRA
jgi:hypothetical protein